MNSTTPLLSLKNISKIYTVKKSLLNKKRLELKAVKDINLDIYPGETIGLVGESGCGKSTLGKIICGLERPTQGQIFWYGQELSWPRKFSPRDIQMIFQDPFSSLNPRQKVKDIIAEPLKINKIGTPKDIQDKVLELAAQVGLSSEHLNRYPHEFSGGQRQRIAIARAISLNPRLIVCDEPVSALDVSVQAQILKLLKRLQTEFNLTYLFISHDLAVVKYLCQRIAVMYLGGLVEIASKKELYSSPKHPYTQALIKAIPIPDPEIQTATIPNTSTDTNTNTYFELPSPINPPSGCSFHPRCPQKMDICTHKKPSWSTISPNHRVRCFLYEKP
jgi:peptide/nickel transport system ATP-binding protein/oligopeptide transport system ATP-binding protein